MCMICSPTTCPSPSRGGLPSQQHPPVVQLRRRQGARPLDSQFYFESHAWRRLRRLRIELHDGQQIASAGRLVSMEHEQHSLHARNQYKLTCTDIVYFFILFYHAAHSCKSWQRCPGAISIAVMGIQLRQLYLSYSELQINHTHIF